MTFRAVALFVTISACLSSPAYSASLEKANALKANGLLPDAKKELVELSYSADASATDKATALLILGDIAIDEKKNDLARENWTKAIAQFPDLPEAKLAEQKLELLTKLSSIGASAYVPATAQHSYPAGTVLVIGPKEFPWSVAQISGALGPTAQPFDGSLIDAMSRARSDSSIAALVEITLSVDTAFESGRVVCLSQNGRKIWEEKVMFNLGGGQERIARRFVDGLAEKIKKRKCPI
jgi:hypothetical protein